MLICACFRRWPRGLHERIGLKTLLMLVAVVCLVAASAQANSTTSVSFTGTASLGNDVVDFFLSGPSFSINSAAPGGPGTYLFICDWESTCNVPSMEIPAFMSYFNQPGNFSGGTVHGVTAYSLTGSITFSDSSFPTGPATNQYGIIGSGPVTFYGQLTGFVFWPLGCESTNTCIGLGPAVFNLDLSGAGTVTASGVNSGINALIYEVDYSFNGTGTATLTPVVPEPSCILLVSSGLAGLAGVRRRRLQRRPGKLVALSACESSGLSVAQTVAQ